jgi:hypothetical protein
MSNAVEIRLCTDVPWGLRATVGSTVYTNVDVVRMAPLSHPDRFIALLDEAGHELHVVDDPSVLDAKSRAALQEALRRRYMTARVQRILSARSELGVAYFDVETDRGRREFVVQNLLEGARWLEADRRLLIFDVDGNRFEIPDVEALDRKSAKLLRTIL